MAMKGASSMKRHLGGMKREGHMRSMGLELQVAAAKETYTLAYIYVVWNEVHMLCACNTQIVCIKDV